MTDKTHVQPILVIVGEWHNIIKVYVLLNGAEYIFKGVLEAVDATFKIYILMNIQFPERIKNVWSFLKTYVYNIADARRATSVIRLSTALTKIK